MSEAASPVPWGKNKTKLLYFSFASTQHGSDIDTQGHINKLKEAKLAILAVVKL